MNHSDSGLAHGTNGAPQLSLETNEAKLTAMENERDYYLRYELSRTSPVQIPENAKITPQIKRGYEQVKYEWESDGYKYMCRWHTHTPNAPAYSQNTWVVMRRIPGKGYGKDAHPAKIEYLIEGEGWIPGHLWDEAKQARARGTETTEQRRLLDNGHWKVSK